VGSPGAPRRAGGRSPPAATTPPARAARVPRRERRPPTARSRSRLPARAPAGPCRAASRSPAERPVDLVEALLPLRGEQRALVRHDDELHRDQEHPRLEQQVVGEPLLEEGHPEEDEGDQDDDERATVDVLADAGHGSSWVVPGRACYLLELEGGRAEAAEQLARGLEAAVVGR